MGDALALDWAAAFPEVAARGGFDAIVGNPPYIRQESLGARSKDALRGFASYDGVADLYAASSSWRTGSRGAAGRYCSDHAEQVADGRVRPPAARVPRGAGQRRGRRGPVARAAVREGGCVPVHRVGTVGAPSERPIRAARIEDAGISVADALLGAGADGTTRPGAEVPQARADRASAGGADAPTPADRASAGDADAPTGADAPTAATRAAVPHGEIDRARWRDGPWHIDAPADLALIERLARAWPALGDVIGGRPTRGVVTGYNQAFVIDRATRERLLADGAGRRAADPAVRQGPRRAALAAGARASAGSSSSIAARRSTSCQRSRRTWPGSARRSSRGRRSTAGRGRAASRARIAGTSRRSGGRAGGRRAPRLFYQDIQTGPACCVDLAGELVPDTTVWVLPSADRYLLAVLNSALYGWYARRRFPPALNGAVRPKLPYLRALLIAAPPPAERAAIEQLVEQRLAAEDARRARRRRAASAASELDAAIDAAVLAAYGLSPAERALIAG